VSWKKLHNPSTVFLFSLYSTISILQAGFPCTAMGTGYYADTGADCTGYFMCTKESTQGLRYKETDCSQILQLDGVNLWLEFKVRIMKGLKIRCKYKKK